MKSHTLQESFLYPINDAVCQSKDFETTKRIILEHLRIQKGRNVSHMIHEVTYNIHNQTKLQFWFYNNLLAYAGQKTVQPIPR